MNELSKHLESLLSKYECVIVPNLGGFVTYFEHAHWENNTLIPPMRQVRFNQKLRYHDGLLAEAYMNYYGINYSEAMEKITLHVSEINNILYNNNTYLLGKIGLLVKDSNSNIILKSNTATFLPENIGLSPISLHKIVIESTPLHPTKFEDDKTIIVKIPKSYAQIARYAAMFILIFLIGTLIPTHQHDNNFTASLIYKKYPNHKTSPNLTIPFRMPNERENTPSTQCYTDVFNGKYNCNFILFKQNELKECKVVENTNTMSESEINLKQVDTEAPSATDKEKLNTDANRYHLIIASLTSEAQAKEYIAQQTYYKMDELTILKCNDKYRVSAKNFHTYKEALHHLDSIKSITDKSVWILCK
ncbi:MAG: hypothetical protein ACI3ZZ_02065 [Candidatus Aphodosoma sp.]